MPERRRGSGGSRQPDLFARSKQPKISLPDNHPMVILTDTVDWTGMEVRAEKIREKKLKNAAGRPPHLRATLTPTPRTALQSSSCSNSVLGNFTLSADLRRTGLPSSTLGMGLQERPCFKRTFDEVLERAQEGGVFLLRGRGPYAVGRRETPAGNVLVFAFLHSLHRPNRRHGGRSVRGLATGLRTGRCASSGPARGIPRPPKANDPLRVERVRATSLANGCKVSKRPAGVHVTCTDTKPAPTRSSGPTAA